jgi:hypothetical protein
VLLLPDVPPVDPDVSELVVPLPDVEPGERPVAPVPVDPLVEPVPAPVLLVEPVPLVELPLVLLVDIDPEDCEPLALPDTSELDPALFVSDRPRVEFLLQPTVPKASARPASRVVSFRLFLFMSDLFDGFRVPSAWRARRAAALRGANCPLHPSAVPRERAGTSMRRFARGIFPRGVPDAAASRNRAAASWLISGPPPGDRGGHVAQQVGFAWV